MNYKLGEVILSRDTIARRVKELAQDIADSYNRDDSVVIVGILTGAAFFLTDLVRELPEDDDGALYVIISKNGRRDENESEEPERKIRTSVAAVNDIPVISNTKAILISGENKKYRYNFLRKFLLSLMNSRIKPNVIALMNDSVKLAAYDSETCDYLKKLEADGVNILVSESCADRLNISEAVGAGLPEDMSVIIERVLECESVISI